jgi:hypothetical protein
VKHRAVGDAPGGIGLRGGPITAVTKSNVWLSRTAARQRRSPRLSGSVDRAGWFNVAATIRSNASVTRVVGFVSNGVVRSAVQVEAVGGVAVAPLRGSFDGGVPSQRSVGPGLIRTCGSPGQLRTAGALHVSSFGSRHHGCRQAPRHGSFEHGRSRERSERAGSFDRLSNTQMEPSRPPELCDPVAAARGSFATLGSLKYQSGWPRFTGTIGAGVESERDLRMESEEGRVESQEAQGVIR